MFRSAVLTFFNIRCGVGPEEGRPRFLVWTQQPTGALASGQALHSYVLPARPILGGAEMPCLWPYVMIALHE